MKTNGKILMVMVLAAVVVVLYGCKKEGSVPTQPPVAVSASDVEAAKAQKVCPVMGGEPNPAIYTDYKGKRVYFCCAGCKPQFEKEPEKYIGKLPQFAK